MHELVTRRDSATALIDDAAGITLSFAELGSRIDDRARELAHLRGHVCFLGTRPDVGSVVDLLALVAAGATVAVLDAATPGTRLDSWRAAYRPAATLGFDAAADTVTGVEPAEPLPESVLLPTSGSTGSAKFVRLTWAGLVANAQQIAEATFIADGDRALIHLPLHFSYGLSVLTSHLAAGAGCVLTTESALGSGFAALLTRTSVTTLPGVPFSLEVYVRTRLFTRAGDHLRAVTTSGGRVGSDLLERLLAQLEPAGIGLWCMYGQTEASGRITVLPPPDLAEAPGSVGYAVPGTVVAVEEPDASGVGTVTVQGPGNMLGYATDRAGLGTSVDPLPILDTGDLGRMDECGRLWLTGRRQRLAKVYGERVSLDDVEEALRVHGVAAAIAIDAGVGVVVDEPGVSTRDLERALGFPPRSIVLLDVPDLPRTPSGKVDYARLSALARGDDQERGHS